MRTVSRNKLFICFRPEVVDMDDHPHPPHRHPPHCHPFEMHRKKRTCLEETKTSTSSVTTSNNGHLISPTPKKNLSRVMKAVFFETILTRRIRDRKSMERESDRSSRGGSSSSSSSSRRRRRKPPRAGEELTSPETTTSSYSPSSSSPPSRSVSAPELRILADQHRISTPRRRVLQNDDNNNYKNPKLYMLLLATLTVTVIWGKLCAILFTSVWMYFLPRRGDADTGSSPRREADMAGRRGESTGEYSNKRVVMEGILGRNHHSRRQREH